MVELAHYSVSRRVRGAHRRLHFHSMARRRQRHYSVPRHQATIHLVSLLVRLLSWWSLFRVGLLGSYLVPGDQRRFCSEVGYHVFAFDSFLGKPLLHITVRDGEADIFKVVANILTGVGTTGLGYYTPFYYGSVVFGAIGSGLLTTFETDTGSPKWIGYQIIYGFGVGLGMQQAIITVQAVLPLKDIPTGTALAMFCQTFGGSLFVSVAQNVFNNRLIDQIVKNVPAVDPDIILHVGATSLKKAIPPQVLPMVQEAYNTALTETWYIAVAMVCLGTIGAVFVEWKSVKGMKPGVPAA